MSIIDQYGRGVSSRHFVNASQRHNPDRPWMPTQLADIDKLIPRHSRNVLVSVSRKMFANMGIVRGAIMQKAMYSVGRGWDAVFNGVDREWGDNVARILNEEWFKVCDIRGRNFDWKTLLYLDSIALDRDGDFAIHLTETETGYPLTQRIGTHRIGQRGNDDKVKEGDYKGYKIQNGVVKNKFGRPVAYHILGDEESEDRFISAQYMVMPFDPEWHEQERGIPGFSHCLDDLRDMAQSTQWEQQVMLMISSIGLIEYNDSGMPDLDDPATSLINDDLATTDGLTTKMMSGGTIKYMRSNSGDKLETVKMDRPSDIWDRFNDRLTRAALTGFKWPYSMSWKSEGNSTIERSDIEKATRTVEDRQDVIKGYATRIMNWAVAKLIKAGRIEAPKNAGDWYAFGFVMPPKISINFKNDTSALLKLYEKGAINMTQLHGMQGQSYEDMMRQRANEVATRKRITAEVEAETKQVIEDREMIMITPNEQAEQPESNTTQKDE